MIPVWVEPVCAAAAALIWTGLLRTDRPRARRFGVLTLAVLVVELIAVNLCGSHAYSSGWRVVLGGVPLVMAWVWSAAIASALPLARELSGSNGPLACVVCALVVATDALVLEPIGVAGGLWTWSEPGLLGVPPLAFLARGAAAWLASAWLLRVESRPGLATEFAVLPCLPLALYALVLGSWWGALRWVSDPLPARFAIAIAWTASVAFWVRGLGQRTSRFTPLARLPLAAVAGVALGSAGAPWIALSLSVGFVYALLAWRSSRSEGEGVRPLRGAWRWAAVLGVLAWDAFMLGPVPEVNPALREVKLPERRALDDYLRNRERRFTDLTPGVEKSIVWADPLAKTRTPVAIVYVHGFSATRQETAPLCDEVAKRIGANLHYTRLSGHGRPGSALAEATVNDWLNDVLEAYRIGQRLGERVVLVGTSTGGTLAAWLAAQPQTELAALVLISPNFAVRNPSARLLHLPWGGLIAEAVVGPEREWSAHNADHELYWTTRYPTSALVRLAGLLDLAQATRLSTVRAPTLMVVSPEDRVIDPSVAIARLEEIPGLTRLVTVSSPQDPSAHVLAGRVLSPLDTPARVEDLVAFLQSATALE